MNNDLCYKKNRGRLISRCYSIADTTFDNYKKYLANLIIAENVDYETNILFSGVWQMHAYHIGYISYHTNTIICGLVLLGNELYIMNYNANSNTFQSTKIF